MELEMLEDWLNNPEPEKDFQEQSCKEKENSSLRSSWRKLECTSRELKKLVCQRR
jgi:hypothetical protein